METTQNLELFSIHQLIDRFEKDIRYGCHSTRAEASRSAAGKELEKRARIDEKEIVPALAARLNEMTGQSLNDLERSVCNGVDMLLTWIQSGDSF